MNKVYIVLDGWDYVVSIHRTRVGAEKYSKDFDRKAYKKLRAEYILEAPSRIEKRILKD
jgi:hypothetical protein